MTSCGTLNYNLCVPFRVNSIVVLNFPDRQSAIGNTYSNRVNIDDMHNHDIEKYFSEAGSNNGHIKSHLVGP